MVSVSSRPKSFLEVPASFFDGARVFSHEDDGSSPIISDEAPAESSSVEVSSHQDSVSLGTLSRWACSTCGNLDFASLEDQRSHFKSDFHRMNVKRKLVGKQPLSEEEFELLVEGDHGRDDISSISGSEEEDNESSDEDITQHTRSLVSSKTRSDNHICLLLQSSDEIATFWKCVVLRDHEKLCKHESYTSFEGRGIVSEDELLQRLKGFVTRRPKEKDLWIILLSRGGHFAGCVFDSKEGTILAHKTHHRYVVRAKAGGKQSTKDGSGNAPKSAGASLRRHNEASLQRDIRDLLRSWKGYLDAAACIFVHAPSKNSNVLFGGEEPPLNRNDERVSTVPITTRRPTFKEAKRVFNELITITYKNRESINEVQITSSSKSSSKKLLEGECEEGERQKLRQEGNHASPCDGRSTDIIGSSVISDARIEKAENLLHDAAKSGNQELVLELLEKGANPCTRDDRARTPYMLAPDKETRNIFRKFMAVNLELWDWHAANVPSALTDDMEAAQAAKQAEKEAKRKAKAKEQKKLRKEKQKAKELAAATSDVSDNTRGALDNMKQNPSLASSREAKKKAEADEREKRAAAAEKRIMAMSHGLTTHSRVCASSSNKPDVSCCSFCGVSLVGMTPFYRLSYQYCTTVCVRAHMVDLQSQ